MKKFTQAFLALFAAVALLAVMAVPAGALQGPEQDNWLEVNNPGVNCNYAYAAVDASNPLPGMAKIFAQGTAIVRNPNPGVGPCSFALTTAQHYPADFMEVQASLHCRWGGSGDSVVWTSSRVSNAGNSGSVSVFNAANNGQLNPCQDPDHLGLEERTTVKTWFRQFAGPPYGGLIEYDETTHWVTP